MHAVCVYDGKALPCHGFLSLSQSLQPSIACTEVHLLIIHTNHQECIIVFC